MVEGYTYLLEDKMHHLDQCLYNEKLYYNTMPQSIRQAKGDIEELNSIHLHKFEMNIAAIPQEPIFSTVSNSRNSSLPRSTKEMKVNVKKNSSKVIN